MNKDIFVLLFVMFFMAALLLINAFHFIGIKTEISQINANSMERCALLECDVSPFGDLSCKSARGLDLLDGNFTMLGGPP